MDEPKPVSKATYGLMCAIPFLTLTVAEGMLLISLRRWVGDVAVGGMIGAILFPNLLTSMIAVNRILKRAGRSRAAIVVEVQARSARKSEGLVGRDEVVEVRYPVGFRRMTALFFALLFLTFALIPSSAIGGAVVALIIRVAIAATAAFSLWFLRRPIARADLDGVVGLPCGAYLVSRFVAWADVATCEILTASDAFGRPGLILPTLHGRHGEALLRMNLIGAPMADQGRLAAYLRARLPEAEPARVAG